MKLKTIARMLLAGVFLYPAFSQAAEPSQPRLTLISNVNIFDGKNEKLLTNMHVLVKDNLIETISDEPLAVIQTDNVTMIDGGGRTLMPGLTDCHWHSMAANFSGNAFAAGEGKLNLVAAQGAEKTLMRGFTTIRDMGGNVFGLKTAIDEGLIPGPRIYPAGALIGQTAGHFDFRFGNQNHVRYGGTTTDWERQGHAYIADGADQVLAAARENLKRGASHIKLATGGGYASPADPLLGNQFTFDEIKAAVDTAGDWGTYLTVHSYHPSAINRAIDAGIKDVGHGQLLDDATLQRMSDEGVFLSTQPFTVCSEPQLDDFSNSKLALVCQGTERVYKAIKKFPDLKGDIRHGFVFYPRRGTRQTNAADGAFAAVV